LLLFLLQHNVGASSGIGEGLALEFARRAHASQSNLQLYISGRDEARLQSVKERCEAISSSLVTVIAKQIDVSNASEMKQWIRKVDSSLVSGLDIVIANAATSERT